MSKVNYIFRFIGVIVVVLAATTQWIVLVERTWAIVWDWYKFDEFSGHITVGKETQIIFYLGSFFAASIGVVLSRFYANRRKDLKTGVSEKLCHLGAASILLGVVYWTAILVSPLASFR